MNLIIDNPYFLMGIIDYRTDLEEAEVKIDFMYTKDINVQESFADIVKRIKSKWNPDLILRTLPEYSPFAEEKVFNCPIVGLIGDWSIMYLSVQRVAKYFHYIFVDSNGLEKVKKMGLKKVENAQMYSFDPNLYRKLDNFKKVYDVSIVANLTHQLHPKRAQWLKRLASLSSRYKIKIFTKKSKDECVKIINQSKITFNYSQRGEMNQRAYQAPACGSLLFQEEENSEVRRFYTNKSHCLLYNEKNFEKLLEYYLSHDQERNRIIDQAYKKVQGYSQFHLFQKIIKRLEQIGLHNIKKEETRISQITKLEQDYDKAIFNFLYACWLEFDYHGYRAQRHFLNEIERDFKELLNLQPNHPELLNNFGLFYAMCSTFSINKRSLIRQKNNQNQSIRLIRKAGNNNPQYAIAFFNLAQIYLLKTEINLAEVTFLKAIDILENDYRNAFSEKGLFFPLRYDSFFYQQWQRIIFEHAKKSDHTKLCLKNLLLHQIYEKLGDIYSEKRNKVRTLEYYKKSIYYQPNSGVTEYKLGRILQKMGHIEKAIHWYKKSMDAAPFYFPAWLSYAKGLYKLDKRGECKRACKKFLSILNAFAVYKGRKRPFKKILNLLEQKEK